MDGIEDVENDSSCLQDRILELEKKVQEQADEIVCLRSTLADVLRRVNQMEGRAPVITTNHVQPMKIIPYGPPRLALSPFPRKSSTGSIGSNHSPASPPTHPPRRLTNYPSNNSLHSEGSASPIPSPCQSKGSPRHTPTSNLASMKKWSVSQELNSSPLHTTRRSYTSGSLYNLHASRIPATTIHQLRHGTKETIFNQEDGVIRMYLRGQPISMHLPTNMLNDYSLEKVTHAPSQRMKLEWVYGYRGRDCRSNLHLLPTGEVVYFTAAVVVLYHVEESVQRHYMAHSADIKCLTVHPNRLLVATGQLAGPDRKALVRVWDSVSLNTLHVLGQGGEFDRAICCLAFSKLDGGSLLCCVDEATEHTISLWEWNKGEKGFKVTETKSSTETVLASEFHPMDKHTLITLGKGHIHFWDIEGGTLAKKLGLFEKFDKPRYVLCMAFTEIGDLLTGDSNGNILLWARGSNRVARTIYSAHEGGVFSICARKDGMFVTGGGKDRRLVEWDQNLSRTGVEAKLPEMAGGVRTLSQGKGSMLMVGTTKNCILQGTFDLNFTVVIQGHTEEIWALAIHPSQQQFISGGFDNWIHLWDTMSHSVVWSKDVGEPVKSACFTPCGNVICLGLLKGRWIALDAATRQIYLASTDGREQLNCIRFSPDGKFLAMGSHDNNIYIHQVSDDGRKYNRIGRCSGHSHCVTHLDWSSDSTYIQTVGGDYEILFWNAGVCRQLSNMSIARDIQWGTHSCSLGFHVFGIWPEGVDVVEVNTCSRSTNCKLLATGDEFGKVKLYNFPACQPKCLHHMYGGHSSEVTAVSFLPDDSRLISLGGRDCTIFQWVLS